MIKLYTDGSCKGNPGPGGWAAIILNKEEKIELSGGEKQTTNNRMEMKAIIEGLKFLKKQKIKEEITIYTDSKLIEQTINSGWKKKANLDLWQELLELNEQLKVTYKWVKGHAQNKYNNECDRLAVSQAEKFA